MSSIPRPVSSPLALLRRWVVDYFNAHSPEAAREFIAPDYRLDIGDVLFDGRDDAWLPAVDEQMQRFPGLGMTVHEVVPAADRVALFFTQHGARGGAGGPIAAWSGVAIYRTQAGRLASCVAQEDYLTRSRQLKSGHPDPIDAPAASPWDTPTLAQDPQAESLVRGWLGSHWPTHVDQIRCDDEYLTGRRLRFEVEKVEIGELFSSGGRVAFHARQTGRYIDGLDCATTERARRQHLNCNGIVHVVDGRIQSGRVIRDRIGLRSRLTAEVSS